MTERCGKTLAVLDEERMTCRIGVYEESLDYCSPCTGAYEETLGRSSPCTQANEETLDHSSQGKLGWYFAQPCIPGLVYIATMNGYVASGPDKTKGGEENV